jgi:hypothetical protein
VEVGTDLCIKLFSSTEPGDSDVSTRRPIVIWDVARSAPNASEADEDRGT